MQIVFRKVVVEAGQLSRGAKIAGRVLFVVSALCLLGGGISIFLSVSRFGEFLERESTTADQIKQQVGHITYSLGASQMFLFVGLGLTGFEVEVV